MTPIRFIVIKAPLSQGGVDARTGQVVMSIGMH